MSAVTFAKKDSAAPAPARQIRIGEPDDAYEREADRVAEDVVTGGSLKRHWSMSGLTSGTTLQRKCSCGGPASTDTECDACKQAKEGATLRRNAAGPAMSALAPTIVHEVVNSPGQPLDQASRDFFEPRLGRDLSSVRLHSDARAIQSAKAVNALAYAVGQHVVLSDTSSGTGTARKRLLAHELTHTLQQSPGTERVVARQPDKQPETPPPSGLRTTGLTAAEAAQLQAARTEKFNVPQGKSTLVGILIDEATGERFPVHSGESGGPYGGTQRGNVPRGPGEGFSGGAPTEKNIGTHIEGHAAAIMHERKITRATLLSPEPPCRVCSSPTRTPAVSVVLPPGGRLTVVYPGAVDTFWSSALPSPKMPAGSGGSTPAGGEAGGEAAQRPRKTPAPSAAAAEEAEGGRRNRRIGSAGEPGAAGPGFTRALGFAALTFAAGVGTSFLQGWMREKIAEDLAKLPSRNVTSVASGSSSMTLEHWPRFACWTC